MRKLPALARGPRLDALEHLVRLYLLHHVPVRHTALGVSHLADQLRNRQLLQLLEAQNRRQVSLPSAFPLNLWRGELLAGAGKCELLLAPEVALEAADWHAFVDTPVVFQLF